MNIILTIILLLTYPILAIDYSSFKGTTLVVNFPAHPHYDAAKILIKEFEKETGINVEVDTLQYLRMHDKQVLEMSKKRGDYDLISYVVFWKTEYVKKGYIEPLESFFSNPKLKDPNYDIDDIIPAYLENIGLVGGKKGYLAGKNALLYGIPFGAETSILAYRKDIFKKHNLSPPISYDELLTTLDYLKSNEPTLYPFTSRGKAGHQITHAWLLHMAPFQGKIFDDNWKPVFDNTNGLKAYSILDKLISYSDPGTASFGFSEMKNSFLQGKAAIYLDSMVISTEVNNPTVSKIKNKVGYSIHPKGTIFASQTGGFGLAIAKNSKNKDAAFLLLQWLTSKAQDKKIVKYGGIPIRKSTFNDEILLKKYPEYKIFSKALEIADTDWRPIIPEWGEINAMFIGTALSDAITNKDSINTALEKAKKQTTSLMKQKGYYEKNEGI